MVTQKDTDCIMLGLLQLMQSGGLCSLLPSQRSHGKKGGDGTLALKCSTGTSTVALNCLACVWVSVPLEQHRTEGKHKNLLKERNKCLSLDPPGIMLTVLCPTASKLGMPTTAHLRHSSHLKMYITNAKDYAGSCGCNVVHSLQELQNKVDDVWAGCLLL